MMLDPAEWLVKHSATAGVAKGAWSRCTRVRPAAGEFLAAAAVRVTAAQIAVSSP